MKKKIKNVNIAVQVTQLLYKLSAPYSENVQWDSYYPVTFWQDENDVEENEKVGKSFCDGPDHEQSAPE